MRWSRLGSVGSKSQKHAVQGLGFMVQGLGFMVQGLGFMVQGLGLGFMV